MPPAEAEVLKLMEELPEDDGGDSREERAFRMWLNSLGIPSYINNLFDDLRDGTTYCLLLATCYLLLATCYLLLATRYSLLATRYSLLATCYSLLTTHYSLLTTHNALLTTHYLRGAW